MQVNKIRPNPQSGLCHRFDINTSKIELPPTSETFKIKLDLPFALKMSEEITVFFLDRKQFLLSNFRASSLKIVSREHFVEAANIYRYVVEFSAQYLDPLDPDVDCQKYVDDLQYNECFESKVKKDLMEEIGCNYPWFTDSQDVCNDSLKLPIETLSKGQDKKT